MKPYKLQLLQALHPDDHNKRYEFCSSMLDDMEEDNFAERLIFSDESTFHLSGKVNHYNIRIWATENPTAVIEHERDSPKMNCLLCDICNQSVWALLLHGENCDRNNLSRYASKLVISPN